MTNSKESAILTVSVEAVKDYQVCSLYYDYAHRQKLPRPHIGRDLMAQRFENTLKRVASFFFYKKQADVTPSYNALINRWEKLWFPKDMDAYDIAVEQHESHTGNVASYTTIAAQALLQFHEDFSRGDEDAILIDESFLVTVGDGLRLEGRFDLVLRKKNNYKVVLWSGRQKRPGSGSWIMDFAAQKLAYEHHRGHRNPNMDVDYAIYDLASSKPGLVDVYPTSDDIRALLYWATEMQNTETFVPRRGYTAYCKGCPFDKPCSNWKDWPDNGRV